ncbi:hypothetical protein ABT189_11225 [Streptomyces sp900105755]|uniref:hypothetical protein n=1 Tax=Streptomyces sp. 900105755 TaxID=3154389 RepID=UPI00332FE1DF
MAEQRSSSAVTAPLRNAASAARRVPGVGVMSRAAEETLDKIGAVSPRSRRLAVYAGAGVLGVAGVVEWPVALTGAAVAWLTQSRPAPSAETSHPELREGDTEGAGHGAYVAMGDSAVAGQQIPTAPGPVREDEMPAGTGTRPGGPPSPPDEPAAPDTGLAEAPAEQAAAHSDQAAQPVPPAAVPATPPTDPLTPPGAQTAPPANEATPSGDADAPPADEGEPPTGPTTAPPSS